MWRRSFVLLLFLVAGLAFLPGRIFAVPQPAIVAWDFVDNIPATDYFKFPTGPNGRDGVFPLIESIGPVPGVVYQRTVGTVQVSFDVYNPGTARTLMFDFRNCSLRVKDRTDVIQLNVLNGHQVFYVGPNEHYICTVTLTGIPNYVSWSDLWAQVVLLPFSPLFSPADNPAPLIEFFLVDGAPQTPMTVPWLDVLRDACHWGYGKTGPSEDLTVSVSRGFHQMWRHVYEGMGPNWTIEGTTFKLSQWFEARYSYYVPTLITNCVDTSSYLQILLSALGDVCDGAVLVGFDGSMQRGFQTNPGTPAGGTKTSWGFAFHQVVDISGFPADSAIAIEYDPSFALLDDVPGWWGFDNYWQVYNPALDPSTACLTQGFIGEPPAPIDYVMYARKCFYIQ